MPRPWDNDVTLPPPTQAGPQTRPWDRDQTLGREAPPAPESAPPERARPDYEPAFIDPKTGALTIPNTLRPATTGDAMDQAHQDRMLAIHQGVNPNALSPNFASKDYSSSPLAEADKSMAPPLLGQMKEDVGGYKSYLRRQRERQEIEEAPFDPATQFVGRHPESGQLAVYGRTPQTNEGMLTRLGRYLSEALVTSPVTSSVPGWLNRAQQAREAQLQAVESGARAAPTGPPPMPLPPIPEAKWPFNEPPPGPPPNPHSSAQPPASIGQRPPALNEPVLGGPTGAQIERDRLEALQRDRDAYDELNIRKPAVTFQRPAGAAIGKMIERIPWLGSPVGYSMDVAVKEAADAARRIGAEMAGGRGTGAEQAGATLQQGLERFRNAGVSDLEPGQLAQYGIQPRAPGSYVGEVRLYQDLPRGTNVPGQAPESGRGLTITRPDGQVEWLNPANHVIVNDSGRLAAYTNSERFQPLRSRGARARARVAAPLREQMGANTVHTNRGVPIEAPGTLDQVIMGRRSAADFSDAELERLIRAPASETSFAAKGEGLYEKADRSIPRVFRVDRSGNPRMIPSPNTGAVLQAIRREITSTPGMAGGQAVLRGEIEEHLINQHANLTFEQLRSIRTQVGRALGGLNPFQQSLNREQLGRIYQALSRDMETGLQDIANRAIIHTQQRFHNSPNYVDPDTARRAVQALRDFRVADRFWRAGMNRMDQFNRVVGTDNPQAAAGIVMRAALNGTKGNMRLLRTAMEALRPEERNQFAAMVLGEMGRPLGHVGGMVKEANWSPTTYMTNWDKMAPEARELLFGGTFARPMDNLTRVMRRLKNQEALSNTSRSGTDFINFLLMFGGGGMLLGGHSAALGAMLAPAGAYSLLLSRPEYVNWIVKYAQLRTAIARAPLASTMPQATVLYNQLYRLTLRDPSLAPVLKAVADEHGIDERRDNNQQPKKRQGVQ